MSLTVIFWVIIGILLVLLAILAFFMFFDVRGWMIRRVGPDYKKGLAHILLNGVWVYRESELLYEGVDAMSYTREVKILGKKHFVTDIVPNQIGYEYDEYTGARLYRVEPGGTIGYCDRGNAPAFDYSSKLISKHVLDRTAAEYAASVNAGSEFSWKPIILIAVLVVVVVAVLFLTGIFKLPGSQKTTPETQTETPAQVQEEEIPSQGDISPVVEEE